MTSFCAKIFRRKPIDKDIGKDSKLIRVLGLIDIIGFGCASAVGSGVFVISGTAGKIYAGANSSLCNIQWILFLIIVVSFDWFVVSTYHGAVLGKFVG